MKKSTYFIPAGLLQCLISIGAIPAGLSLLLIPDGSGVGLPMTLLTGSPFQNFFVPGLFLFVIIGVFQAIGAFYSFRKKSQAGSLAVLLGGLLAIWIIAQVFFIGYQSILQVIYLFLAFAEIFIGWQILKGNKD